jgi:hypothetical protein
MTDAEQTGTSAQMLEAFEKYRIEKFGAYDPYPLDAFTHFAVGYRAAASQDAREALEECASRCRYDGDLFHDQGNYERRDASWKAGDMAGAVLAALTDAAALAAPQPGAGASEPVAWCGWHPERGYNFATMADTEQGAVSRLIRTGIAGHHGWSVRQLVYATPSPTEAERTECDCTDECLHKPDCVFERDAVSGAPKS